MVTVLAGAPAAGAGTHHVDIETSKRCRTMRPSAPAPHAAAATAEEEQDEAVDEPDAEADGHDVNPGMTEHAAEVMALPGAITGSPHAHLFLCR